MTGTYPGFDGEVGRTFAGSQGSWPARADAAAGRAERHRHARRRPRLRGPRAATAPRSTPRTSTRSRSVASGARTSTPRRCARRRAPRCSPAWSRTGPGSAPSRISTPASRATRGARSGRGDDRRDPAGPGGLRHDDGGEVAPREGLGLLGRRAAALVAVPARLRPLLRDPRRVHEPAPAAPHRRGQPPRRGRPLPRRLLLHRRPHRSRDLDDQRAQGEQPGAAVLPLLRARRGARAAARARPTTSRSTAVATTAAGTSCAPSGSPASRSSASCPTDLELPPRNTELNHDVRAVGRPRRARARPRSRATWRSTRRWSIASTRTSVGSSPRSRSSASSTTRSSCSSPTTARRVRARSPARPRTTCTCSRATTSTPTTPGSTTSAGRRPPRTTRAGGRWRRGPRSGSTRSTRTRVGTRCRSASRGRTGSTQRGDHPEPVRARHGPAPDVARAHRRRAARRIATASRSRRSPARASRRRSTDPAAPSTHPEQIFECNGHRGLYRDGWELVTLHQPFTAVRRRGVGAVPPRRRPDRAAQPRRRGARAACARWPQRWEALAWENQVYPLDEGSAIKYLVRPERSAVYGEPVTIRRGTPTLERWRSVQLLWFRSVNIRVQLHHRAADQGMLVAHGDQGAGYALYVLDGELFFVHNNGRGGMLEVSGGAMADGVREVVADLRGHRRVRRGSSRSRSTARCGRRGLGSRCCSAWRRSRGSTSGSTGARRCRGRSTSGSDRSRTPARSTRSRTRRASPAPTPPPA